MLAKIKSDFLLKFFLSAAVLAVLVAVLPKYVFRPDPEGVWIEHLLSLKEKAYRASPEPQVLMVAGSSALLGFESELFSQLTKQRAVNLGLHAGLGIPYILSRAEGLLKSGDTAILAFEYELYSSGRERMVKRFVSFYDRDYIYTTKFTDWGDFLLGYGFIDFVYVAFRKLAPMDYGRGYSFNLTSFGDYKDNTVEASSPDGVVSSGVFPPAPLNSDTFNLMREFVERCKKKGVTVLVTYPPLHRQVAYSQRSDFQAYFKSLDDAFYSLGAGFVGTLEKSELETADMYDFRYHPNSEGRRRFTAQLASYYKAYRTSGDLSK